MRAMKPRSGRAAEDRVFNAVQNAILDHRLAPGTKLVERDLSELLGVSRGAVRAALARLGHSLLVELRPNRGAVIANPTPSETRDVFEARRVIESAVVQGLARSITAKQLAELRAFVAEEQRRTTAATAGTASGCRSASTSCCPSWPATARSTASWSTSSAARLC